MNHRLPSTKNLQAFLATAEHLNFTHAASAMAMTQGAISRQIQSLESMMGVSLFYRHARGLALTPDGLKFVPLAEAVIHQLQNAVREVAESANRIKLNAPSCITTFLLEKLTAFQISHPDINVELTSTTKHQLHPNFDSFDLVIMYGRASATKRVRQVLLFEERLSPVCAPQIWHQAQQEGGGDAFQSLRRVNWLHANAEQSDWQLWIDSIGLSQLRGARNQTFATLDQAMNAAQLGYGMTVGDLTLAARQIEHQQLIQPFEHEVLSGKGYYLMAPADSDNPNLSAFVEWLASVNTP